MNYIIIDYPMYNNTSKSLLYTVICSSNGNVNGNTGTNFILRNTNSIPLISIVNRNQIIRNRITM